MLSKLVTDGFVLRNLELGYRKRGYYNNNNNNNDDDDDDNNNKNNNNNNKQQTNRKKTALKQDSTELNWYQVAINRSLWTMT